MHKKTKLSSSKVVGILIPVFVLGAIGTWFIQDIYFFGGKSQSNAIATTQMGSTDKEHGSVSAIDDGDTIRVVLKTKVKTVRIVGIDSPEKGVCKAIVDKFISTLITGREVTLTGEPKEGEIDKSGRLLRYVEIDGKDLGELMLENGYAKVHASHIFGRRGVYEQVEGKARDAKLGLWSDECQEIKK